MKRTRVTAAVVVSALAVTPACGRLSRHLFGGGTSSRTGTLLVVPPRGPAGSSFSLTAGGFKPGEKMTFEIDIPKHKPFIGVPHTAGPDGQVTSTYNPQAGDPPGKYNVKAVGNRSTRANTSLEIVAGSTPATTTTTTTRRHQP